MKLSQTRVKIVKEFEKKANFVDERLTKEAISFLSDYVSQAINDYTESIVRMVDEQIKIWKSMDEDLPVPRLQDQIVEALNDIKEELGK